MKGHETKRRKETEKGKERERKGRGKEEVSKARSNVKFQLRRLLTRVSRAGQQ